MIMSDRIVRVFATADIGREALHRLRQRGYDVEVYADAEPPPKSLIVEKVRSGIDALITTLRDDIDEEVFVAGFKKLRIVAQIAGGVDKIYHPAGKRFRITVSHTAGLV